MSKTKASAAKTSTTAADVAIQEIAATVETENKTVALVAATDIAWSRDHALAFMAENVVSTQGAMETITKYAILAAMRGAENKLIVSTIKSAAAQRGASDSYAGRVAIEARRFAAFVLTDADNVTLAVLPISEAFNALNAKVDAFNTAPATETSDGGERLPWRTMYDRLAALDPEAVARAEKKAADAAAKAAAEVTEGAAETLNDTLDDVTAASPLDAILALLSELKPEELDLVSAAINAIQQPVQVLEDAA